MIMLMTGVVGISAGEGETELKRGLLVIILYVCVSGAPG